MRDFTRCISALNSAAGRELTAEEIEQAFDRIKRTASDLRAGKTPASAPAGSPEALIRQAAELEARRMVEEADLKARRVEMDARTVAARRAEQAAMAGLNPVETVRRLLVNDPDGKANQFSLETRALGVSQYLKRGLVDTWSALGNGFFDYFQRGDMARRLLAEMRGEDSGDARAKRGAQAWAKTSEEARLWFNERGGQIGKLEDWSAPQHHSQDLVARAAGILGKQTTPDAVPNRDAWVDFVLPLVNRGRYVDLAGRPMGDAELRQFLGAAWDTIATGGATKVNDAPRGAGARANRHSVERQIHFKDADAQMAYWEKFSDRTLPDVLLGHLETMAKDIAFIEHFGSNPNATFRMLRDEALQAAKLKSPQDSGKVDAQIAKLDRLYDYAAGNSKPVADMRVARGFDIARYLNVAGKLGSAFWASLIGDKVMFEAIGRVNNLPPLKLWFNELRMLNPANAADRRSLRRHGLMLDYMTQALSRFGDELGSNALSSKLANGVMRVSGMAAVNEWRRGAWALTAMDAIGHQVKSKDWAKIGLQDMRLLTSYGITEADWRVWKLAKLEDLGHGNKDGLTPDAIRDIPDDALRQAGFDGDLQAVRRDAAVKLLGALTSESHNAVLEPGWKQRAMMYGGLQRGVVRDELTRAFWQFKAFPITQFERILDIGLSRPTVSGRVAFLTTLPILQTIAGAMMIQVQEMLAGKDPRPMADWKFWAAAFLKGGTLGLYGDFLFSQSGTTRYGTGPLEAVAGPTIGAIADIATFIAQAPGLAAEGKDPQVAAKALGIAKGFVPGQNLWFTKAATDHWLFQNAQEALNPGYLASVRARTVREFGNDWWWEPGEALPDRAPELGVAFESNP